MIPNLQIILIWYCTKQFRDSSKSAIHFMQPFGELVEFCMEYSGYSYEEKVKLCIIQYVQNFLEKPIPSLNKAATSHVSSFLCPLAAYFCYVPK